MAVSLSPLAGAAAQFLDDSGNVLSGGKIYTYLAGTTTPATTYTSASGSTPHTNPILLTSAGRVPSGEIWVTDGISYKFIIKSSTNVLIGTYDNISSVDLAGIEAQIAAIDGTITIIESDVAGNTASIEENATAIAGIQAKWGVTVNTNGHVAGIELLSGEDPSTSFTVDATKFVVKKPDTTDGIAWDGGTSQLKISGDLTANTFTGTAVIATGNIQENAVTVPEISSNSGVELTTIDTWYTVITDTVVLDTAATVYASVSSALYYPAGVSATINELYIDGTLVATCGGDAYIASMTLAGGKDCTAGTKTVYLRSKRTGVSLAGFGDVDMFIQGAKR